MRIAVVHDYLNQYGGAERVVEVFRELYPDAPVYTSILDPERMPPALRGPGIHVSFMQDLPLVLRLFRWYLPVYPVAFECFDLSPYDVILSSSSAFAKGVKKRGRQLHICYCYTPMRFVWRYEDYIAREQFPGWLKALLRPILTPIKKWDLANTGGVDFFVAISKNVAERIRQIYGRESTVINPPVDTSFFRPSDVDGDHYLVVSRLSFYKRVDLAVDAFNELGLPLRIIGDGPAFSSLKARSRTNVEFLGRVPDYEVAKQMAECRALIFPGEEDFGLVPLEAMSAGRPVIAYYGGGAAETVIDGETGVFFRPQTAAALSSAVRRFASMRFSKDKIRHHAKRFDKAVFMEKISEFVKRRYEEKFSR